MPKENHHRKISPFVFNFNSFYFWFDVFLAAFSVLILGTNFFHIYIGSPALNKSILVVLSICGLLPVLANALKALIRQQLTIDLLASIALIFALINKEFHSAVFISLMLISARFLANFTENRTKYAIQGLLKLKPTKVLVKTEQGIVEKPVEKIEINDLVVIEPGMRIAVDGIIAEGNAAVDQSSLTGESQPVSKTTGDKVFSSTLNLSGSLVIKTEKVGEDTTFSKILKLIEESQKEKSPIFSLTDKFVNFYIIFSLVGSILLYLATRNLSLVLAVLLVTCADDVAIAIPLAFTAAIGTAAKKGIIIKGADFIEKLPKLDLMIFDKTGTLTKGKPKIKQIFVFKDYSEKNFLAMAGGLLLASNHPTSKAVCSYIKEKKIKISEVREIYEEPGYGIEGTVNGKKILAGNIKFLEKHNVIFPADQLSLIQQEKSLGRMLMIIGIDNFLIGFLTLSDEIRPQARWIIDELKKIGLKRMVILSGDNEIITGEIAKEVGIKEFHANLLAQDKVNFIKNSLNEKYKVGMVGDGVNDAASLALADVGLAMGTIGSDAAIEAADIALMKDNLKNIADVIQISQETISIVKQDLIMWGVVNFIGLALVLTGFLNPSAAAAYNFLTDFIPPLNSLRLLKFQRNNKTFSL